MLNSLQDFALTRFSPLDWVVCYDDFDQGFNGWMDLKPNWTQPGFNPVASTVDKTQWGPIMLSSSNFAWAGTHGSMDGTYALKLCTRPVANPYEQPPAPGALSHAIKRLSRYKPINHLQLEMFYTYTPEQDRIGLGEKDIRAFGVLFDIQDERCRTYAGVRYLNSVNGELHQRWQHVAAADVTDEQWAYGNKGEFNKRGIDPFWYGQRRSDGTTDGFAEIEGGEQVLCYNESDDKFNWLYLRLLIDLENLRYVELQSGDKTFDLSQYEMTQSVQYKNINGLLNPLLWIENDTDRRVMLMVDSVLVTAS